MKLHFLPHSPFVRKVLVAAHETGQAGDLDVVESHVFDPATPLLADNPMGKVPALVRDDGSTLYDSTVICEWLDSRHDGTKLFPPSGEPRWQALRRNALGDGLGQAATWNIRERYRPEEERSGTYIAYYERAIGRCLDALEQEAVSAASEDRFDIGDISIACALSYVDLRYPERQWPERYPALARWFERALNRPSMQATPLAPYSGPLQPSG